MTQQKQRLKEKQSLATEMDAAEKAMKKKAKKFLQKKYPEDQIQAIIDEFVPLLSKALYKADTRAFNKLMNIAYGKPK